MTQSRYGAPEEVLEIEEVERPEPAECEVLIRVHAAAVAADEWHLARGLPYFARLETGLRRPKNSVPGRDVAGQVASVGSKVDRFRPGDVVFGWCDGAYAEFVAVSEDSLAEKPANVSFEEAASVPISALTALQALRDKAGVERGSKVLVNGASGGVGSFAVQIAKSMGAEVTGVCSARSAPLVSLMGADRVIDYEREAFTENGHRYDAILDMVQDRPFAECRRALETGGTLVLVGSAAVDLSGARARWFKGTDRWLKAVALSPFVSQRLRPLIHTDSQEDLAHIGELIEAGELKPNVDGAVGLDDAPTIIDGHGNGRSRQRLVVAP